MATVIKRPKPFPCVPEQTVLTPQALCSAEYLDPLPAPCSRYLCKMLCNLWVGVILMQVGFPLVTQMVKSPPAMQETQVQSLGWEDPLEKEMATHSSILVWRISWIEDPGRLQSMGSQRVGHD